MTEGIAEKGRVDRSFPRRFRLGENKNYRYVYRRGKSYPSRNMVLIYLKGKEQRFGFSVSSKVGNAVTRNRIRRYMREEVRHARTGLKTGKYVFIARPALKNATHAELSKEMRGVLHRAGLNKEES